ncbi:MAG: hypothetical protein JWP01_3519 [Myxococcales bacterium]|nr:hypothetical protein [Myxococcales bacterium]
MVRFALLASIVVVSLAGTAAADLRSFTQTYEYASVPEGNTTLELWHTQGRATWDASSPQSFDQVIEIEHGITEHWDIGVRSVFSQTTGDAISAEALGLSATKLASRYRFADRGEWPVDTLLFGEVSKRFGDSIYRLEAQLVLARDFDQLTVAANAVVAIELGNDVPETGLDVGYAAGLTYQVHPKLRIGAESWGGRDGDDVAVSVGPALSWAPTSSFWVALTAGFGVVDADELSARAIVGIEL